MPTIGHVAVGLAAGRMLARDPEELRPAMFTGACLAVLPDLDWIGALSGIPPYGLWSHRGLCHSLLGAVVLGLCYALLNGRRWRAGKRAVALWAIATVASHGMLDMVNRGGIVLWLWPLVDGYLSAPWQPIPSVENLSVLFSGRIVTILLAELAIFSPALVYAFQTSPPRRSSPAAQDG